jgi:energy-coupling factor transport system ATP-binding protein
LDFEECNTLSEIIRTDHLSFRYPGVDDTPGVPVFEDLDLQIEEGTFVAILGSNGCGKSTLAKHFNAILLPSGGTVWVCGMDTKQEDRIIPIRRNVGMVFQNPDNQIVANVVEEDVAFGPENLAIPQPEIVERVTWALEQVNMSQYAKRSPHKLSGGQKQRIAIAGALAIKPNVLVLDESTAMLDPQGRKEVLAVAKQLNANGMTVVLITHFMEEVLDADKVIVMKRGKVVAEGTPMEIFNQQSLVEDAFLRVPRTVELAQNY